MSAEGAQGDTAMERSSRALSTKLTRYLTEPYVYLLCFLALAEPFPSSHCICDPTGKFCPSNTHTLNRRQEAGAHGYSNPMTQVTSVIG